MRKPPNRLTQAQYFQLCKALMDNQEELKAERPSLADCAKRLGNELSMAVTADQVGSAQKSTGIVWESVKRDGAKIREAFFVQLAKIEERVASIEQNGHPNLQEEIDRIKANYRDHVAEVAVLRGLVHHLYQALGQPAPHGYVLPNPPKTEVIGRK